MDEDIQFNLRMIDQLSGPSRAMDEALSSLDQALKRERAELAATEAALRSMARASVVDIEAHRSMSAQAQAQRDSVAKLNQELHAHGVSAAQAGAASKRLAADAKEASNALVDAASEAATSTGSIEELAASAGELLNPFTAAIAVVTGFGAALAFAGEKGVELSLHAAAAKEEVEDALSLVVDTQEAVADTYEGLEGVASRFGASAEATQKVAQAVALAGVSGKDAILDAVTAVTEASKFSATAGERIQGIIEKAGASGKFKIADKAFKGSGVSSNDVVAQLAAQTGRSIPVLRAQLKAGQITAEEGVSALTKAVDVKLGQGALEKGRNLDSSMNRLKNSLSTLFENVNIKPFTDEVARLADMFDTTTENGKHLQDQLTALMDGAFSVLGQVILGIRSGILDLEIGFYSLEIAAAPLVALWYKAFPDDGKQAVDDYGTVATVTEIAILSLASGVGILALALGGAALSLALFLAPFALVAGLAFAAGYGIAFLADKAVDAAKWVGHLGGAAVRAGEEMIEGLITGIEAKAAALVNSVKATGQKAIDAFRHVFDSHSPSRVMMSIGADVSEGLALGADNAHPEHRLRLVASRSVEAMGESASAGVRSHSASAGPSHSSSSLDLSGMHVEINGVRDAQTVPGLLMDTFADAFEKGSLIMGSRPAPRAA